VSEHEDLERRLEYLDAEAAQLRDRLKAIQTACDHSSLPKRVLGESYLDGCPDCGFIVIGLAPGSER
jgi:hypothetical protein